ncbi:winged helix-turn-helix transcriptional regulator [Micromonospora sp. M51]|uniref:ArsR/SmtB family transcription factor n=1 Tax=Micromonospora sp. M51 TaxID=2824889 RepID=UPI001B3883EC|nr:winged helix-turn-helix domain-containing protein [Micromonospora sp. M51]MBQ1012360.1 winged helix-turn-helix transcriptional regulator [Micromonospora sp. M51]
MMLVGLAARDLAMTRFAVSPLWEAVASVRVVKRPQQFPEHLAWYERVRPRLTGVDWRLFADLVRMPTPVIPAFLCPPPAMSQPTLDVELATLVATSAEAVRAGVEALPGPRSSRLAALHADPATELPRLATAIRGYADAVIAPYWPRMRALLEREVLLGAQRMATDGVHGLLNHLNQFVRLEAETLTVEHVTLAGSVRLDGRGLLLVPSVFIGARVWSNFDSPGQPVLRFPARAVGTLWERDPTPHGRGLARVLGRTRAALLHELAVPTSTLELAGRCGLATGTVSQHLGALREAGLVGAHRVGRFVLYARTTAAEVLIAASGAGAT